MDKRRLGLQEFEVFPERKSPTAQDEISPLHNLGVDKAPQCVPDGLFLNGVFIICIQTDNLLSYDDM